MRRDQKVVRPNRLPGRLEPGSNPPVVNRELLGKVRQDIDGAKEFAHPLRELWRCSVGDSMVNLASECPFFDSKWDSQVHAIPISAADSLVIRRAHVLARGNSLGSLIRFAVGSGLVIFQKAADLMHAFMQHGDDADPSVAQCLPVDEVPPVAKDGAVHP